jgi:phage terminase large subunit
LEDLTDISDAELLELEKLLEQEEVYQLKQGLTNYSDKTNPNYKFLRECYLNPDIRGAILEGSSRSGKTWSSVDFIIWICTEVESNCTINIFRETYTEFKETLYEDFKNRLDDFNLPNPFHHAKEVKSFKIGNNKIAFLGCDKLGKTHGAGADYVFYNEAMHIPRGVFDQSEMRCRKFWWSDYNPSLTEHYIFTSVITRPEVGFLRTTFKDNPYISKPEKQKILSYEPWESGTYEITDNGELLYKGEPLTDKNQPPPHVKNVEQGTADSFMWKVYGLGLRGAMQGVIFPNVEYIDKFPDLAYVYGNDFGFTSDPNTTVKYAQEGNNIYLELLSYQPIETATDLSSYWEAIGIEQYLPITCDSSDKYTGENKGTVEMVKELRQLGWQVKKVKKTKSVMYWLTKMREYKIHIVKNENYRHAKKEAENYRFKEIQGIQINQPIDDFNHFWDAARYAFMSYNVQEYTMFY